MANKKSNRKPGRPARPLPEPIGKPMDEIVGIVFRAKPKRSTEWRYKRKAKGTE